MSSDAQSKIGSEAAEQIVTDIDALSDQVYSLCMADIANHETSDLKVLAKSLRSVFHELRDKSAHFLNSNPEEDNMVRVRMVYERSENIYRTRLSLIHNIRTSKSESFVSDLSFASNLKASMDPNEKCANYVENNVKSSQNQFNDILADDEVELSPDDSVSQVYKTPQALHPNEKLSRKVLFKCNSESAAPPGWFDNSRPPLLQGPFTSHHQGLLALPVTLRNLSNIRRTPNTML